MAEGESKGRGDHSNACMLHCVRVCISILRLHGPRCHTMGLVNAGRKVAKPDN